jgi:hypothetical protein
VRKLWAIPMVILMASLSINAQTLKVTKATAHSVTLSWTASTTAGVTYNVYRGAAAAGPFAVISTATSPGSTTTYTDSSVTPGATYFYQVTSACGPTACGPNFQPNSESVPSNQINTVIPNPQLPAAPTNLIFQTITVVTGTK